MLVATIVATVMLCLFLGLTRASLLVFALCLAALSPYHPKLLIPLSLIALGVIAKIHLEKKAKKK
ncbi:hypothetical protein [Marinobacterium lacunae]|uniref:hypothetical protein n=1 Tax=Marinobacterium lacunae TaxID=1232683 RepID=UPI0005660373|nr:hypothetical protein [Marinobacterium lacunae]